MKRATSLLLTASVCVLMIASPGLAQLDPNPNGFPLGDHFNLNIISKKADYQCALEEDEFGNPVYGNVIFVPEGEAVKIEMQSGKIKGKKLSDLGDTLRVIDPCAGFVNDTTTDTAAILQLPPHNAGYAVFARMVGTPSGEMLITPGLDYAQDDDGNYLYLGDIDQAFTCPNKTIDPHEKGSQGKGNTGRSVATEITCLFEWSGEVCYFDPDLTGQSYCGTCLEVDGMGACSDYDDCTRTDICCQECCDTPDGPCCDAMLCFDELDNCLDGALPVHGNCGEPDSLEPVVCPIDSVHFSVWCKEYPPTWVFNIADFVQYFWSATHNGKVVQLRFYQK